MTGHQIACIYTSPLPSAPAGSSDEANAMLIAAAPDLLEACLSAEKWLESWASAEPYLSTIRAAIKKAKGEA